LKFVKKPPEARGFFLDKIERQAEAGGQKRKILIMGKGNKIREYFLAVLGRETGKHGK